MDGFYASRWCNVFYRCFLGIKTEFLCPKMLNSGRLWWIQHNSSQETPQISASCVWPCETKNKCMSPGGTLVESVDGSYAESILETERVWSSSNCEHDRSETNPYKISEFDFTCMGRQDGEFYPSKYCNVFHRCASGKRSDFQCPKATNTPYDLWWNEAVGQCDWPCRVNCSKPVYGSTKLPNEIKAEDLFYNEEQCRVETPRVTTPPIVSQIMTKLIKKPFPDEGFLCLTPGLVISPKYCNVYYSCKGFNMPPQFSFYCVDGYFDNESKTCKTTGEYVCKYLPALSYPIITISDLNPPEDVECASNFNSYIINSNLFCNIYYECDGKSSMPKTNRCFDRDNLEDAVYDRDTKSCVRKHQAQCMGEIYSIKVRYQSSPVDHTRFSDLQSLSCRADQQYLAEHDKYCNLYHSCILGKYQMYACISIGNFDKTSYFYYTNGNCGAPNAAQCGYHKSIYEYSKLFPTELNKLIQTETVQAAERIMSVVPSAVSTFSLHPTYGPIIMIKSQQFSPDCTPTSEPLISDKKYCNLFYECADSKKSTFVCIDSSTGKLNGMFDLSLKACKPFNSLECALVFNPDKNDLMNSPEPTEQPAPTSSPAAELSFSTDSTFSCVGRSNGYYESEWCNVFFQCINEKRIDTRCSSSGTSSTNNVEYDLWWEQQNPTYNPSNVLKFKGSDESAKCEWPCKIKCNKKIWTAKGVPEPLIENIVRVDLELHPECFPNKTAVVTKASVYEPVELTSVDPSGFSCDDHDGLFKDPLFCNIFHECMSGKKKSFVCKSKMNEISLFDAGTKSCISKEEGFAKCGGLIYEAEFLYVPAIKDLPPQVDKCVQTGVFKAHVKDTAYCDLFYWCNNLNEAPIYFYCDIDFLTTDIAIFNLDKKQCELKKNFQCAPNEKIYSNTLKLKMNFIDSAENAENMTMLDYQVKKVADETGWEAAANYMQIEPMQFKSEFSCPANAAGYYADKDYCDIFHYCFASGKYKTFACSPLSNEYQLWWSYQGNTQIHNVNLEFI